MLGILKETDRAVPAKADTGINPKRAVDLTRKIRLYLAAQPDGNRGLCG